MAATACAVATADSLSPSSSWYTAMPSSATFVFVIVVVAVLIVVDVVVAVVILAVAVVVVDARTTTPVADHVRASPYF